MRFEVLMAVKELMLVFRVVMFWRNILPPSSAWKMEAGFSSKKLISTNKSTWCCNPEDQH
jgi:hypothetical protein